MNPFKIILLAFLIFLSVLSLQTQAQEQARLHENLTTYLLNIHQKKGFSGELLVARGEDILFRKAIGLASAENNLALQEGATYRIASISKTFTASLIALAQEEQLLDYNDSPTQYIVGLADKYRQLTIHQLLTHTSGLPHNEAIADYWLIKSKVELDQQQILEEINKLELLFEPGTGMHYSSLGYYLLATVLEAVYQDDFRNILKQQILMNLQMGESGVANSLDIIPGLAKGYHLLSDDSLVVAPYRNFSMVKGAGDMHATATDLLKWNNSFLHNSLLKEQTVKSIFSPHSAVSRHNTKNYGYGWFIEGGKQKKYTHGGGTWGYTSYLALYPDSGTSIILLSNVSTLPMESIGNDIEKIVFGLDFTMPVIENRVSSDSTDLNVYCGSYVSESGKMQLKIMRNGAGLFAQLAGNPAFQIYPKGDHQYFGKKVEVVFSFKIEQGTVSGLTADRMGQTFFFKKL